MSSDRSNVLLFPSPPGDAAPASPHRSPGVGATITLDAGEVTRRLVQELADAWVVRPRPPRQEASRTEAFEQGFRGAYPRPPDTPGMSNVLPFPRKAAAPPPRRPLEDDAVTGPISAGDVVRLIGRDQALASAPEQRLVPTVVLSVRRSDGCRHAIALPTFRALLGEPTWSLVTQFVVTGRWYQEGLDLALALLVCADRHRGDLTPVDDTRARIALYMFVLDLLDRLDAWDTYLEVWQQLRQRTAYTVRSGRDAATEPRAQPYVLSQQGGQTHLHFLWYTDRRRRLIARKVATRRAGKPVGHLRHHSPAALSEAERQRRLAWVARSGHLLRWQDAESARAADAQLRGALPDADRPAAERRTRSDHPPVLSLLLAD